MLDLINVRKTFNPRTVNEKVALNGVNLHLNDGDFVTVIGGNGAGKSTTLNAIAGVWPVDEGQITNVATSEPYRRRGIGGALLHAMIREARRRGLLSLSLEVRASNTAAISLYERHGFSVAGRRRGFYTHPREDALVMIKEMKN